MVSFEPPVTHLNCYGKCCKGILYAFNIIFMISGMVGMAVGVWAIVDPTSDRIVALINSTMYITAAFVLIGAGAAAVAVSFIGCCGARYENRCLLVVYTILLLLIFIAEFASGVIALALYTQVTKFANIEMRDSVIEKYHQPNQREATDAWDYIQEMHDCCGFEGVQHEAAQLYQISKWFDNSLILKVPPSCCKRDENMEPINLDSCQSRLNNDMTYVNNRGCRPFVVYEAVKFSTAISAVGLAISLLQLIGMVVAFCLFRRI